MKKLIDFKDDVLVANIQDYADKHCEGNFNMAVRVLCRTELTRMAIDRAENKK